jgi:hypothetical protein
VGVRARMLRGISGCTVEVAGRAQDQGAD